VGADAVICLALDPGKTTGWAVPDASGAFRLDYLSDAKLPGPARHGAWFGRARLWLDSLIDLHGVEVVVLERQPIIRGNGSLVTLGLRAVFLEVAWLRSLMVDEVTSTAWQSWAKGYGWKKVASRSGGDEVDAAAILQWWVAIRLPQVKAA
jgi:hypothetical protein